MTDGTFGFEEFNQQLNLLTQEIKDRLEMALTKILSDLEADAKANHPYVDRTGDNTASIRGFVTDITDAAISGQLSASMNYSLFLETRWNGKYAFLGPVIDANKEKILDILGALVL